MALPKIDTLAARAALLRPQAPRTVRGEFSAECLYLKDFRKITGATAEELAEAMGLESSSVYRRLSGNVRTTPADLQRLNECFDAVRRASR